MSIYDIKVSHEIGAPTVQLVVSRAGVTADMGTIVELPCITSYTNKQALTIVDMARFAKTAEYKDLVEYHSALDALPGFVVTGFDPKYDAPAAVATRAAKKNEPARPWTVFGLGKGKHEFKA